MSPKRKDLTPATLRGSLVRVFVEGGMVKVMWREARGAPRQYDTRPDTTEGRAEAKAFARGKAEALRNPVTADAPVLTLRALWERYAGANFQEQRIRTRQLHTERWRKWELMWGREFPAERVTTEMVAQFRSTLTRNGTAVNQARQAIRTVKRVFNWADEMELIQRNRVGRYRFRQGKDEKTHEPSEFRSHEWEAVLRELGGQTWGRWRPWAATLFAGSQGARIRAILHLQWSDIDLEAMTVTWRGEVDKQGRTRTQPLTDDAYSAILTALYWRAQRGYEGPFLFFSLDKRSGTRKDKRETPGVYRYQAWSAAFTKAEKKAGIVHEKYRAAHGFRKMASGNVLEQTQDPKAALDWIGDKDPRRMREYLKVREDRMRQVAEQLSTPKVP